MKKNSSFRRRPPYALLPFLMILTGAVLWGMAGCGLTPGIFGAQTAGQAAAERSAQIHLVVADFKGGREAAGQNALRRIVADAGGSSEAYVEVASGLTENNCAPEAARFLADAVRNRELAKDPLLWTALAEAYGSANNSAQAAVASSEAARRADAILSTADQPVPGQSEAARAAAALFLEASRFYSDRKQPEAALKTVRAAYRLMRDDPLTLNALGYTLADLGTTSKDIEEAVQMTRQAVSLEPDNAEYLDSYGWALFKKDDLQGARRVLREAVDRDPDIPELHFHLGVVYGALGLNRDAGLELDRAIQLRHDYRDARHAREMLKNQPPGKGVLEGA